MESNKVSLLEQDILFLLLGKPGSGKGTVGKAIAEHHGIDYLSTGDALRTLPDTDERKKLQSEGKLLSDQQIFEIAEPYLNKNKSRILDGWPRTLGQHSMLVDYFSRKDQSNLFFMLIECSDEEIIKRLKLRNLNEGRADDSDEKMKVRFAEYAEKTLPLVDLIYSGKPSIRFDRFDVFFVNGGSYGIRINGEKTKEEVLENAKAAIDSVTNLRRYLSTKKV